MRDAALNGDCGGLNEVGAVRAGSVGRGHNIARAARCLRGHAVVTVAGKCEGAELQVDPAIVELSLISPLFSASTGLAERIPRRYLLFWTRVPSSAEPRQMRARQIFNEVLQSCSALIIPFRKIRIKKRQPPIMDAPTALQLIAQWMTLSEQLRCNLHRSLFPIRYTKVLGDPVADEHFIAVYRPSRRPTSIIRSSSTLPVVEQHNNSYPGQPRQPGAILLKQATTARARARAEINVASFNGVTLQERTGRGAP